MKFNIGAVATIFIAFVVGLTKADCPQYDNDVSKCQAASGCNSPTFLPGVQQSCGNMCAA